MLTSIHKTLAIAMPLRCIRTGLSKGIKNSLNLGYCRQAQTSTLHCAKMYMEHENQYAYSILEEKRHAISLISSKNPASLTEDSLKQMLEEEWSKKSASQLFECFSMLADYCRENKLCISNSTFDNFIDSLTDNIKNASDIELVTIFHSLNKFPDPDSIRTRNYIEVWVALDDECLNRSKQWLFNDLLDFTSLFYMLNVTRASDFSKKVINKLASKAKQLTPSQLVKTMFFVGILRRSPFDMHNLELQMQAIFEEFTVDELAIIAMGFFKSKTPIRSSELVLKIVDKIIDTTQEIHEVSLAALLKVIRYSLKIPDDKINKLLDTLQHEVPRLSLMCNVHIALLGTATLTFHDKCLSSIAEKFISSINQARLKDLERVVFACSTFNFYPPTKENFIEKIISELRKPERQDEIEKYGRSFISCIEYLGLLNYYPADLINKALGTEFLEKTYGKHFFMYSRAVLSVHNSCKIFCADANINCLSDKVAETLAKKYTDFVPSEDFAKQYNLSEKMFLDVLKLLKEARGGPEYVVGDHILTHHQRGDIILCNDHQGTPLPVGDSFSKKKFGLLKKPPDNNNWIVLIIAGRNAIIHSTDTPTGHFQAKVRELKKLGFHAVIVPWSIYSKLDTKEEKIKYLNNLVEKADKLSSYPKKL